MLKLITQLLGIPAPGPSQQFHQHLQRYGHAATQAEHTKGYKGKSD